MLKKIITWMVTLATSLGIGAAPVGGAEVETVPTVDFENTFFEPLGLKLISSEGTLLLSDSPEYVGPRGGILYRDTVAGKSRIYFYHVNEMKEHHKIGLVVENKGSSPAEVNVIRSIWANPSPDYFTVGRDLSHKELRDSDTHNSHMVLKPGLKKVLVKGLEKVAVKKDALFSGIVDFVSTAPVEVSIMMLPMNMNTVGSTTLLPLLPHDDVHLRGTYEQSMEKRFAVEPAYNVEKGAAFLKLTDDVNDPFVTGIDALSGNMPVTNRGNYGMGSVIHLETMGNGEFDVFFNPLGGAFAGVLGLSYNGMEEMKFLPPVPDYIVGNETIYDTLHLGRYEAGKPLTFRYMPPGASNLPVRLLFIPVAPEKKK